MFAKSYFELQKNRKKGNDEIMGILMPIPPEIPKSGLYNFILLDVLFIPNVDSLK